MTKPRVQGGASPPCDHEDDDDGLAAHEAALTQEVPNLLEAMNRSSVDVNTLERQVSDAQDRYKKLLGQWSRAYEELRAEHGNAIDRVKPYFDAAQVSNTALTRVNCVVREFQAASSQHALAKTELRTIEEQLEFGAHMVQLDGSQQDGLSRATVRVLRCQQERDGCEQEYARVLREYQEAQQAVDAWREQIGDATIKRFFPCFRHLQQQQITLTSEQARINTFSDRARAAKNIYNNTMRDLDRINIAVHAARREHMALGDEQKPKAGKGIGVCEVPESAPEVTGAETEFEHLAKSETSEGAAAAKVLVATVDESPFA